MPSPFRYRLARHQAGPYETILQTAARVQEGDQAAEGEQRNDHEARGVERRGCAGEPPRQPQGRKEQEGGGLGDEAPEETAQPRGRRSVPAHHRQPEQP